jgi:hypothetical protein
MKLEQLTGSPGRLRILDFDVEARPLAWYGGDFVTKQPTVISWKFINEREKIQVAYIGESDRSSLVLQEERAMLEAFRVAYDAADIVTGHFIRGFDLPLLDGALMRLGSRPLGDKLSQDTKLDLAKAQGISKSQENLGAMFELEHPKVQMNTSSWAEANMLLPHGIEVAKKRCMGDVRQHIEMRSIMVQRGALRAPTLWTNEGLGIGGYHA